MKNVIFLCQKNIHICIIFRYMLYGRKLPIVVLHTWRGVIGYEAPKIERMRVNSLILWINSFGMGQTRTKNNYNWSRQIQDNLEAMGICRRNWSRPVERIVVRLSDRIKFHTSGAPSVESQAAQILVKKNIIRWNTILLNWRWDYFKQANYLNGGKKYKICTKR